ncbi:MAG TPA: MFS transporter [Mycobacteriales bacterium]|nr:MFS transporter [Mycobacteriales bacterium]
MAKPPGRASLWRNPDYVKFWTGESVSQVGSQVTLLALPLAAVLTLDASPWQMGVLNAASYLPFLLLTLFVGVWVDRARRRPAMVASALGRSAVLFSIPLLSAAGLLGMGYLYAAAFVLGVLTVVFEVTWQAYLPTLVDRDELVEANSTLQVSTSAAQVAGPALAGWLVALLTAPVALLVDACSFLVSTATLAAIRRPEPAREVPAADGTPKEPVLRSIRAGLRFTLGDARLRACVLEAGTYNLFWLVLETTFLLYATHRLGMSPTLIGVVLGGGAVGALLAATVAGRLSARLGIGNTVTLSMVVGCAAPLLVPLAGGPRPVEVGLLVLSFFVGGAGSTVANIQVVSLRQAITPDSMLGRMNASYRFVSWGTVPVGALLGGWLGSAAGLRAALVVGAIGVLASALWIVFSPIRSLRELPPPADAATTPPGGDETGPTLQQTH